MLLEPVGECVSVLLVPLALPRGLSFLDFPTRFYLSACASISVIFLVTASLILQHHPSRTSLPQQAPTFVYSLISSTKPNKSFIPMELRVALFS